MTDSWIAVHTAIAVAVVVFLIFRWRVDPTISLVLGSTYLGLAGGLGYAGTVEGITIGFGEIMTEVGLIVGFGVMLGSLLTAMGVLQALVHKLVGTVGQRRLPYALAVTLSVLFPSVYTDVQFVLASPMVRTAAAGDDESNFPRLILGMVSGGIVGLVLVVPGVGTLAIAGILGVPLGTMLTYGLIIGPLTALITVAVGIRIVTRIWNSSTDVMESTTSSATIAGTGQPAIASTGVSDTPQSHATVPQLSMERSHRVTWLAVTTALILPVALIAAGAIVKATSDELHGPLFIISQPVFALLIGLLAAYVIARRSLGSEAVADVLTNAFRQVGAVLMVTGAGGVFGAVIARTDLADTVGGWFGDTNSAKWWTIVFLAWAIAAVAHLAIGSISVAAITAAGVVSPLVEGSDVPLAIVALAIAAGAMFAIHVNSNGFWMLRTLLGISTSGALKTLTLVSSLASIVALGLVLVLASIA